MVDALTVAVRRRVLPERTAELEAWLRRVSEAAARFTGHLGARVARPADPAREDRVLIFRFDSHANLEAWERSAERAAWLRRSSR